MAYAIQIENLGKMYKLYNRPSDKVIDAFGLNKLFFWKKDSYQEFWALRDLNLEVKKGERLGIVGRNGAGKSTLLKLISRNISPTEGKINVRGRIQALMELGTGFHPEFTGRENIRASLAYNGIPPRKVKILEEEIIDFSELDEFIDQPVKVYSSGMYSRLAFAVSTVLEPEILIIDEILGAGDASFITKCSLRIKKLTEETGATVLFVSHSMESVIEMCNRAILLNRGKIIHDADPLTISKIYNSMIRAEDELLMRARESKVRKKDYRALNTLQADSVPLLFRFKSDGQHPKGKHYIYDIIINEGEVTICNIAVGSPMDNDINSPNRIIDGMGMMDWSKSIKHKGKYCRAYQNEEGVYCHAPFQMCIAKHLVDNDNLEIYINAEISSTEKIYLEMWKDDEYINIATLEGDVQNYKIPLSPYLQDAIPKNQEQIEQTTNRDKALDEAAANIETKEDNSYTYQEFTSKLSIYGSQEIIIESVEVVDFNKESRRVFYLGETMEFRIHLKANEKIETFVLVASILTVDGKPAGQVFCNSEDIGLDRFTGETDISLLFSPLRFGQGEYVVSIGIFKEYDISVEKENEAFCVVDRAVFFKVVQPENMRKGIGAFAHPVIWSNKDIQYCYDAILHLKENSL